MGTVWPATAAGIERGLLSAGLLLALLCCKSPSSSSKKPAPKARPAPTKPAPRLPVLPTHRYFHRHAVHHNQPERRVFDTHDVVVFEREIVPQVPKPKTLFDKLPSGPPSFVNTSQGVLACRIQIGGSWDPGTNRTDPYGTLRFDGVGDIFFSDTETEEVYFTLPAFPLSKNIDGYLTLIDSDTFFHDGMGTFEFHYSGTAPFSFSGTVHKHELSCRFLDAAGVEAAAQPLLKKTRLPLARAGKPPRVTLDKEHFGYLRSPLHDAWKSLDAVAAYTGWKHAQLIDLVADLKQQQQRWSAEVRKRQELLVKTLPAPGKTIKLRTWHIGVKGVVCDAARAEAYRKGNVHLRNYTHPCFVELKMHKHGSYRSGIGSLHLQGIDGGGFDVDMGIIKVYAKGNVVYDHLTDVPKGETVTAIAQPTAEVAFGTHPGAAPANLGGKLRLLRTCRDKGRRCVLRLE